MATRRFISRLNRRQVVIHTAAGWFLAHAATMCYYLVNLRMALIADQVKTSGNYAALGKQAVSLADITDLLLWQYVAGYIGLFCSFFISLIIATRRKWFWFNSVIAFAAGIVCIRYDDNVWRYAKLLLLRPGWLFSSEALQLVTHIIVLLAIALFLFFSKKLIRFIEKKKYLL